MFRYYLSLIYVLLVFSSCRNSSPDTDIGGFERLEPEFDSLVSANAFIEIIADSLEWSEGPLWLEKQQTLLFSDIPRNTVYQWSSSGGQSVYLKPSGYTGQEERGGEVGSNGLVLSPSGHLILCQHGDRRIARMEAALDSPRAVFSTLAGEYQGKKFDSPNDLVFHSDGSAYFTDPPYGLENNVDDKGKMAPYQGVYRISNGNIQLLLDSITRPNGIGITPDQKTLIVANSDESKPYWYAFDIADSGRLTNARIFASVLNGPFEETGAPDGFKIDRRGNLFGSGPGGIWIFSPTGKLLGRIRINQRVSNCAFADEDKTLFVTADQYVLKIRLR